MLQAAIGDSLHLNSSSTLKCSVIGYRWNGHFQGLTGFVLHIPQYVASNIVYRITNTLYTMTALPTALFITQNFTLQGNK